MSITSLYYIAILLLAPLLLANRYRKYIYLVLSLLVFYLASGSLIAFAFSLLYVLIPYFWTKIFKTNWPLFVIWVLLFLYLKRYDWIFGALNIPYLIPFSVFGLSYLVFRIIDYVTNAQFLEANQKSLIDYLNYILSFYTIICGPIMSFSSFYSDFYKDRQMPSGRDILQQLSRISAGYVKILLFSYFLSKYSNIFYDRLCSGFDLLSFVLFAALNVWYIYFNFTGYCDVVIGSAKIAGFDLPENFNKPYLACDMSDFWNRQHITLTKWITSYLFTSSVKGLMKKFSMDTAQYIGFFIAFLVAGLWHGTTLSYLLYGIINAIGVCLTKAYTSFMTKKLGGKKQFREFRKKKTVHIAELLLTQIYVYISLTCVGFDMFSLIFGK